VLVVFEIQEEVLQLMEQNHILDLQSLHLVVVKELLIHLVLKAVVVVEEILVEMEQVIHSQAR